MRSPAISSGWPSSSETARSSWDMTFSFIVSSSLAAVTAWRRSSIMSANSRYSSVRPPSTRRTLRTYPDNDVDAAAVTALSDAECLLLNRARFDGDFDRGFLAFFIARCSCLHNICRCSDHTITLMYSETTIVIRHQQADSIRFCRHQVQYSSLAAICSRIFCKRNFL